MEKKAQLHEGNEKVSIENTKIPKYFSILLKCLHLRWEQKYSPLCIHVCAFVSHLWHTTQKPQKKSFSKPRKENFSAMEWKKSSSKNSNWFKISIFFCSVFLFFELKKWLRLLWFHVKTRWGKEDEALWQTWTNNVYITYGKKTAKVSCWLIRLDDILRGKNRWMLLFHQLWKSKEEWKRKFQAFLNKCTKKKRKLLLNKKEFYKCFLRECSTLSHFVQYPFDNIFMTMETSNGNVKKMQCSKSCRRKGKKYQLVFRIF